MFRAALAFLALALPAAAQLQWENPWQNFVRSPEDGSIEVAFAFRNAGKTPVKIRSVKSSCGCTTTRLEKESYGPGEKGVVTAKFVFGDRRGPHRKLVTVKSDDGQVQELNLVVRIEQLLTASPALVFWRRGEPAEPRRVQLTAGNGREVRVKGVTSSNPRVTVKLETVKEGAEYALMVRPADTTRKETAELIVQTDFPPDAPTACKIFARVK